MKKLTIIFLAISFLLLMVLTITQLNLFEPEINHKNKSSIPAACKVNNLYKVNCPTVKGMGNIGFLKMLPKVANKKFENFAVGGSAVGDKKIKFENLLIQKFENAPHLRGIFFENLLIDFLKQIRHL